MTSLIAAAGTTVTLPDWALLVIAIGSVCTGLVAIATAYRKVVRPLLHVGAVIEAAFPVWVQIAKKYSDEQGGEILSAELVGLATNQGVIAENQRLLVEKLDEAMGKLNELHDYSHQMKHDIIGDVGKLGLALGTTTTIVDALVSAAEELRHVREDLQAGDGGDGDGSER